MLTLTDAAVDAIRLVSGATHPAGGAARATSEPGGALPMRLVAPIGPGSPAVHLEPAGDPAPTDTVVSRGGATLYLDRALTERLRDKTLHAQAASDSTGSVEFTLLDQP